MNGLYPIIRRLRRPLVVPDAAPVVVSKGDAPAPLQTETAARAGESVAGKPPESPGESPALPEKASHAKTARKRSAR